EDAKDDADDGMHAALGFWVRVGVLVTENAQEKREGAENQAETRNETENARVVGSKGSAVFPRNECVTFLFVPSIIVKGITASGPAAWPVIIIAVPLSEPGCRSLPLLEACGGWSPWLGDGSLLRSVALNDLGYDRRLLVAGVGSPDDRVAPRTEKLFPSQFLRRLNFAAAVCAHGDE